MANRRFAVRSRKRVTSWIGVNIDIPDLVVGTSKFLAAINESDLEQYPTPTVVRVRGRVSAFTDDSSTPGGFGTVYMGIIVTTATAFAAAAIPSPIPPASNDFLWWDSVTVGASAADVIGEDVTVDRIIVDSKAMRKVGINEVLVFVAQLITQEGVMVVNLAGGLRTLLKAP